jgi:hypothetical protein
MRTAFVAAVCSAVAGFWIVSMPALAQQKTVKACQAEWRADKAGNQAKGIAEKAYVEQCRAGAAQPTASPAAASPATAPPTAPASTPATPASAPSATATAPARATKRTQTPTPSGSDQFSTETLARTHCPADTVVWANLTSKIYHFASFKNYGTTKNGAYMCEKDATDQGLRPSKAEKPPA